MSAIALRLSGLSYKEIARQCGVSVDAVKLWYRAGVVPARRRAAVIRLLDRAIQHNEARTDALRMELARLEASDRVDALPAEGAAVPRARAREAAEAGADGGGEG